MSSSQRAERTTSGNLLIRAANPTKPADIVQVSVITTSKSRTIGSIIAASWFETEREARDFAIRYGELLRAKYPDWELGQEKMDDNFDIVEVSLLKAPHNIKLSLAQDERDGRSMWRMSLGLEWDKQSEQWAAWQEQATSENVASRTSEHEELLKNSDIRGL